MKPNPFQVGRNQGIEVYAESSPQRVPVTAATQRLPRESLRSERVRMGHQSHQASRDERQKWQPPGLGSLTSPLILTAWDTSPAAVAVVWGPEHRLIYQNRASRATFGGKQYGVPLNEAFAGANHDFIATLDDVLRRGQAIDVPARPIKVPDLMGNQLTMHYVLAPLGTIGSPAIGVVITAVDVSAELRLELASKRSRLLAEISEQLNAAPNPRSALQSLVGQLVPEIADLSTVFIASQDPSPAAGRADAPALRPAMALSPALAAVGEPPASSPREGPWPWGPELAAGISVLIPIDEANLVSIAPDRASQEWLTAVKANSIAVIPFVVPGSLAGALVLVSAAPRSPFTREDLPFLEDVAARAGAAVAHARSFRRTHEVAQDLQRALLPAEPPRLPDMAVAALYVAGSEDVEVGGDWWDVVELGAGRVALGVGDVSGRGIPAAIVMGQARAAMRAAGLAHLSPTDVLSVLDAQTEELVRVTDHDKGAPPRFATALYAVYEPAEAGLRVANAGHLPFLVRAESGEVEVIEVPTGTPLGVGVGGWKEVSVPFPVGSTLAMFTDGLVESRTQDFDEGIRLLSRSFSRLGGTTDLCTLSSELLQAAGRAESHQDDIALLLLRAEPSAAIVASLDEVIAGPGEIGPTRRRVGDVLARAGASELVGAVQHVLSELLANAIEHGHSKASLHVHVTGVRVVIEVTDQALAKPVMRAALASDERGRGLAVTEALCSRWGVRFDQSGKTVWAEFLRRPQGQ